jgi:hypothetical protein
MMDRHVFKGVFACLKYEFVPFLILINKAKTKLIFHLEITAHVTELPLC